MKQKTQLKRERQCLYSSLTKKSLILFPSSLDHCTQCPTNTFTGERLAIVGDITLVYKEDSANDYSMGYINPKYWRIY